MRELRTSEVVLRSSFPVMLIVCLADCLAPSLFAQSDAFSLSATTIVATGLTKPVGIAAAPGDATRLFVVEQFVGTSGRVRIVDLTTNTLLPSPFLTVAGVSAGGEQGLLSICFHPNYKTNGQFFVNSIRNGQTLIERYTVSSDPNVANPRSVKLIMAITRVTPYHNSGWMEFGPDGMLYIGVGDNAQTMALLTLPESPFGKILRIDPDSGDPYAIPPSNPWVSTPGLDEGWANGLRNPWRCAFDSFTGELWIADVGESSYEEIDVQPALMGGRHYGWPCWQGNAPHLTLGNCPQPSAVAFPLHAYAQSEIGGSGCAVTGGRVYRGPGSASLRGTYFFADLCSNKIFTITRSDSGVPTITDRTAAVQLSWLVTSFGEDALGNLYYCGHAGRLVRINAIDTGCVADMNADGVVDAVDLSSMLSRWGQDGAAREDLDRNNRVDAADLAMLLGSWGNCP